jgi:ABC-type Zn uptake system ZnuABC Zn-binding protein ZnuA
MKHKTILKVVVLALIAFTFGCGQSRQKDDTSSQNSPEFKGVVKLDVRE